MQVIILDHGLKEKIDGPRDGAVSDGERRCFGGDRPSFVADGTETGGGDVRPAFGTGTNAEAPARPPNGYYAR